MFGWQGVGKHICESLQSGEQGQAGNLPSFRRDSPYPYLSSPIISFCPSLSFQSHALPKMAAPKGHPWLMCMQFQGHHPTAPTLPVFPLNPDTASESSSQDPSQYRLELARTNRSEQADTFLQIRIGQATCSI